MTAPSTPGNWADGVKWSSCGDDEKVHRSDDQWQVMSMDIMYERCCGLDVHKTNSGGVRVATRIRTASPPKRSAPLAR